MTTAIEKLKEYIENNYQHIFIKDSKLKFAKIKRKNIATKTADIVYKEFMKAESASLIESGQSESLATLKDDFEDYKLELRERIESEPDEEEAPRMSQAQIDKYNELEGAICAIDSVTGEETFLYPETGRCVTSTPEAMRKFFGPKLFPYLFKIISPMSEYDPFTNSYLFTKQVKEGKVKNITVFNTYSPPEWKEPLFSNQPLPGVKANEVPDVYTKYLTILTDNHEPSVKFLMNWLALCLHRKSDSYLCLFGEYGVGKGIFLQLVKGLLGSHNIYIGGNKDVSSDFNDHLFSKQVVVIDEFDPGQCDESKLKSFINNSLRSEGKGGKTSEKGFAASIILTSNPKDARIDKFNFEQRRYSFPNLGKVDLKHILITKQERQALLDDMLDPDNLAKFGSYLFHKGKHLIANNLITDEQYVCEEYYNHIMSDAMPEWQNQIIEWAITSPGLEIRYSELKKELHLRAGAPTVKKTNGNTNYIIEKKHGGVHYIKSLVQTPLEQIVSSQTNQFKTNEDIVVELYDNSGEITFDSTYYSDDEEEEEETL